MKRITALTALAAILAAPAFAQERPGAQPPAAASGEDARAEANSQGQSDVVVVTARLREEAIQDVPAAVSAVSVDQLEALGGVVDLKDVSYMLPGVGMIDTGTFTTENNIRGAGSATARQVGVESAIATLRDGASITGGSAGRTFTTIDLFDVSRIEVTRGPQGSLYGVNAVGGVMQAVTQRPKDEFGFSVRGGWGFDIDQSDVEAILNLPLTDTLALRGGVQRTERDGGFFYNAATGRYGDRSDYTGYRASALWRPLDDLSVYVVHDASVENIPFNGIRSINRQNDPTVAAPPADPDGPFVYGYNYETPQSRKVHTTMAVVEWETPIGTVTSTTMDRLRKTWLPFDGDGTAPAYAQAPTTPATCSARNCVTVFSDETDMWSQDVRLDTEISEVLSLQLGANVQSRESVFVSTTDGRATSLANPAPSGTQNRSSISDESDDQTGAFAALSWKATPELTIDASARYNRSDKDFLGYLVPRTASATACPYIDYESIDPRGGSVCVQNLSDLSASFETTTPAISARYALAPNWRVYASVAEGYRSGGFNNQSSVDPSIPVSFDPESALAYELGTKFELGRAYFTVSAYRNNFDDMINPAVRVGPDNVARNYRINAGKAYTQGVDFELTGSTDGPAGGRLNYNLAANYIEGEYEDGTYEGQKVEGSPDWAFTAGGLYSLPLGDDWRFVSALSWRGQRGGYAAFSSVSNNVKLADFDLVNAMVGIEKGRWRLDLSASNLLDDQYEIQRDPNASYYSDGRVVELRLSYRFGSEE
jgi:iron complex outermembrane receptor protein